MDVWIWTLLLNIYGQLLKIKVFVVYVYIYIYIYIYMIFISLSLSLSLSLSIYIYTYIHIHMYIYIYFFSGPWGFDFLHAYISWEELWIHDVLTHGSMYLDMGFETLSLDFCELKSWELTVRPIFLPRIFLLRFADSNFPAKFPVDVRIPPLQVKILLESNMVAIFYPFSLFCEIVISLLSLQNRQEQSSTYFRGG